MNIRKWLILLLAIVTVTSLATYSGLTRSLFTDKEQSTNDTLGLRWGQFTINDGFENTGAGWADNWKDNATTTWFQDSARSHTGIYSAGSIATNNGYLTSNEIDASTSSNITVSFWIFIKNLEPDDCWVQTYNGTAYNNWQDATVIGNNNAWTYFTAVITDPQFLFAGFRLRFDTTLLNNSNDEVNIDDVVITTDTVPPVAPAGLIASAGNEQINLDWNDNSEPDLWGYNIYRTSVSGGPYTVLNAMPVSNSYYTDIGLYGGGTYYYVVTAVDYGKNESGYSSESGATAVNAAPAAPTSVNATDGNEQITIGWNPNVETDLSGYNIYRGAMSGGPYSKINGGLVTSTNYTDSLLYGGGTYHYVITTMDNAGLESVDSAETSATAGNLAPAAPNSVNATAGNERITIGWSPNIETDLAGYDVYRSNVIGGLYSKLNGSTVVSDNYTDTPLYGGGTYYYVITAVDNGSLESSPSTETSATAVNVAPVAPGGLSSTPGGEAVSLNWNDNSESDVAGYNLYRSTVSGGPYSRINGGLITSSQYLDSPLFGGGTFYYVVSAVDNGSLESSNSAETSATAANVAPAAPSGLSAAPGSEKIILTWTTNTEADLAGYNVYRGNVSGGPYSKLNVSLVTSSNYTNTGLYGGGTYYYVVSAVDTGSLESGNSGESGATAVNAAPSAPTGLSASPGNELITLDWNDNSEPDLAGYNVYRGTVSGGPYSKINGSLIVSSNYSDVGLYGGGTYYYLVTAQDTGSLESGNSTEANANALNAAPFSPGGLNATAGDGLVNLVWNPNTETDLAGYNIYRGTSSGNYTKTKNLWASSNYTDTGISPGTTYYYAVTAVDNGTAESGYSNEANATPVDNPPAAPTGLVATRGNQTVYLNWNDNTEGDLNGYNVYRGTVSGNYTKINVSLVPVSAYTDSAVLSGTTYYYVVTAVDMGGHESGNSNNSSAIPWSPSLWTQTTQADFQLGISTNVSTTASSGNITLSAGGNAGGANMILLWDSGVAPAGWSIVSGVGGDFYQRLPLGASAYGGTGGSATHTHTVGLVSVSAPATVSVSSGTDINAASTTEVHTLGSGSTSAVSNLPGYRNLQVIKYNSGVPSTIPKGAIAIFDSTLPGGWTRYAAEDNSFVRGESTANATGGSNTETHTVNITLGASSGSTTVKSGSPSTSIAASGETASASGTTASIDKRPPYITVLLAQADSDTLVPAGMIAMFDASPAGDWNVISGAGGDLNSRFIVGSATYGTTGGSTNHTPTNLTMTTGAPSTTGAAKTSPSNTTVASGTHAHSVVVSLGSSSDMPPYINVIFAKALYAASGSCASQVLDTTVEASEWAEISWDDLLLSGANITLQVRASDYSFQSDNNTITWIDVGNSGDGTISVTSGLPNGRYKQWKAVLTPDGTRLKTPVLKEVRTYYNGG